MIKKVVVYKCDFCGKEKQQSSEDFPYADDWHLIRGFNFGIPTGKKVIIDHADLITDTPLHFCSRKCFSKYVSSKIEEATKGKGNSQMENFDVQPKIDEMGQRNWDY